MLNYENIFMLLNDCIINSSNLGPSYHPIHGLINATPKLEVYCTRGIDPFFTTCQTHKFIVVLWATFEHILGKVWLTSFGKDLYEIFLLHYLLSDNKIVTFISFSSHSCKIVRAMPVVPASAFASKNGKVKGYE